MAELKAGSKIAGKDVIVYLVEGEEKVVIGGQRTASLELTAETIDTTDKTNDGWGTSMPGMKNWSLSTDGLVVTGDEGYNKLFEALLNSTDVIVEFTIGDRLFTGTAGVTNLSSEASYDDAVTYSAEFVAKTPLEVVDSSKGE